MIRLARWRTYAAVGLLGAAALLSWSLVTDRFHDAPSVPAQENVAPGRPAARPLEGPPMEIDAGELARAGRERKDNGLGMALCWCPPGSFHMGRAPERTRQPGEAAPVRVTLRQGFWMSKFEVTQAQWRSVMGVTLREQRAKDPDQPRPVGDGTTRDHVGEGADYPIYFVSHAEAEEFCRKLTAAERDAGRLEPGWEYRLPTEAQWEYACRAGTTTATAFGDRLGGAQANFDGSKPFNGAPVGPYHHETTPVGKYPANGWGLHDMHGNVWEWCRDGFTDAPPGGTDPVQEPTSPRRVYRGGCWHNPGVMCLSTSRAWGQVDGRGSGLGLRVALVPTRP